MKNEINCRIILQKPSVGVNYGLQTGHGSRYEVVQCQRAVGDDLPFEFTINTKLGKDSSIDFSGSFVQGFFSGRFIYINIGASVGQVNTEWNRRLKIPLVGITQLQIDAMMKIPSILETSVPGTGKYGRSNCATVKLFAVRSVIRE